MSRAEAVVLTRPAGLADGDGDGGATGLSGLGALPGSTEAAAAACGDQPAPVQ